jgi:hypothetical protein
MCFIFHKNILYYLAVSELYITTLLIYYIELNVGSKKSAEITKFMDVFIYLFFYSHIVLSECSVWSK